MKKNIFNVIVFLLAALANGCCREEAPITVQSSAILLDVRSEAEFAQKHLPRAINIPHDQIKEKILQVIPDKNTQLLIYCRSGRRVKIAIKTLKQLGYKRTADLGGMSEAEKSPYFIEFSTRNKR